MCIKCVGEHASHNCTLEEKEPPHCYNCGRMHIASWRGCISFAETNGSPAKKRSKRINWKGPFRKQETNPKGATRKEGTGTQRKLTSVGNGGEKLSTLSERKEGEQPAAHGQSCNNGLTATRGVEGTASVIKLQLQSPCLLKKRKQLRVKKQSRDLAKS